MKSSTKFLYYRKKMGLSQRAVAEVLNCSASAYSKYENGDREPSISALILLADFYHISVDELIGHQVVDKETPIDFAIKSNSLEAEQKRDDLLIEEQVARLKKHFNLEKAEKIGDGLIYKYVNEFNDFHDCFSVNDVYREIDYLQTLSQVKIVDLVDILGVSKSGYYHWRKYGDVVRQRNESIADEIMKYEFAALNSAGYLSVALYLRKLPNRPDLKNISVARVKRIMDEFEIIPEDLRNKKNALLAREIKQYSASDLPVKDNLVGRNFSYTAPPCMYWCIDITEIKTDEGKLYLCAIVDLCGRFLVGYSTSKKMDMRLVNRAVRKARTNVEKYMSIPENLCTIHSDRGPQFRNDDTIKLIANQGMKQSMSRAYRPNDNACIESFFSSLKCEYLYRYKLPSFDVANKMIARYVKFYNTIRVHQTVMDVPKKYWLARVKELDLA